MGIQKFIEFINSLKLLEFVICFSLQAFGSNLFVQFQTVEKSFKATELPGKGHINLTLQMFAISN